MVILLHILMVYTTVWDFEYIPTLQTRICTNAELQLLTYGKQGWY